jgi:hypothetical protein
MNTLKHVETFANGTEVACLKHSALLYVSILVLLENRTICP